MIWVAEVLAAIAIVEAFVLADYARSWRQQRARADALETGNIERLGLLRRMNDLCAQQTVRIRDLERLVEIRDETIAREHQLLGRAVACSEIALNRTLAAEDEAKGLSVSLRAAKDLCGQQAVRITQFERTAELLSESKAAQAESERRQLPVKAATGAAVRAMAERVNAEDANAD